MSSEGHSSIEESKIRARIKSWAAALHDKDIDRLMAHYTPDIMSFNLAPPLQYRGDACRESMAAWMAHYDGPVNCEHHDVRITTSGDVAFSTSFNHVTGVRTDGEKQNFWVRATIGYRKLAGEWLVEHEHISVPIDMESGQALFNLKP